MPGKLETAIERELMNYFSLRSWVAVKTISASTTQPGTLLRPIHDFSGCISSSSLVIVYHRVTSYNASYLHFFSILRSDFLVESLR